MLESEWSKEQEEKSRAGLVEAYEREGFRLKRRQNTSEFLKSRKIKVIKKIKSSSTIVLEEESGQSESGRQKYEENDFERRRAEELHDLARSCRWSCRMVNFSARVCPTRPATRPSPGRVGCPDGVFCAFLRFSRPLVVIFGYLILWKGIYTLVQHF